MSNVERSRAVVGRNVSRPVAGTGASLAPALSGSLAQRAATGRCDLRRRAGCCRDEREQRCRPSVDCCLHRFDPFECVRPANLATRTSVGVHVDRNVNERISIDLQVRLKVLNSGMAGLLIGAVAERAGVTATTIRYYEQVGLLPAPVRSASGYRRYGETAVEELRFIRKAQVLGFSLDEITEILKLSRSGRTPCSRVRSLAHQHLAAVAERIRQLQRFYDQLAQEVAKWDGKTTPTCVGLCQIIAMSDASQASSQDLSLSLRRSRRPPRKAVRR
jgi:MerR family transcriptional regulator, copper efflux regulator